MLTRQQYLYNQTLHEEYYMQFVTPELVEYLKNRRGLLRSCVASKDTHFNDTTTLAVWDGLLTSSLVSLAQLREAGEGYSLSTYLCISKAAVRAILRGE